VSRSTATLVPTAVFLRKLDDVASAIERQGVAAVYEAAVSSLRRWFADRRGLDLPVGVCHGDLTFSNVLVSSDAKALALIDFLDSFLESPALDLVKLRQDTQFGWSAFIGPQRMDRTRFMQIMGYIDGQLRERFAAMPWYRDCIDALQCLNLLRIAPYAQDADTHRFLHRCLQTVALQPT
jgi:aminoglycoside phosphotransferase (APT) family kinase protein